jgi:hypothetical protein
MCIHYLYAELATTGKDARGARDLELQKVKVGLRFNLI